VSATTHFSSANNIYQSFLHVDMTKWHTWGVLWSPSQILYTVDGQVWGRDTGTSSVPTIPMHLGIQQQTWCGASPAWACPTPGSNVETQVDWVAEYNPTSTVPAPSTPTTSPVTWTATSSASTSTTSSSQINFPELKSSTPELYVGYAFVDNVAAAGSTKYTSYDVTANKNLFAYAPQVTSLVPTATQSPSGSSYALAAMIKATGLSGTVVPVGQPVQDVFSGTTAALYVSPASVGNVEVLTLHLSNSQDHASVSSGNATWQLAARSTTSGDNEIWLGTVTSTAPGAIVVTPAIKWDSAELTAEEFSVQVPHFSSLRPAP